MSRRAPRKHGNSVRLVRQSIEDVYTEIEPLILAAGPVPVGLLAFARLLVERIDCQLACLLDEQALTASDLQRVVRRAESRFSSHGLVNGGTRVRCPIFLRPTLPFPNGGGKESPCYLPAGASSN